MKLLFPLVLLMVVVGISTAFPDKSYPSGKEDHHPDSKEKPVVPVVVVVVEPTPAHYNGGKPGYSGGSDKPGYSGGSGNPGYSGGGSNPGYSGSGGNSEYSGSGNKPGYSSGGSYSG